MVVGLASTDGTSGIDVANCRSLLIALLDLMARALACNAWTDKHASTHLIAAASALEQSTMKQPGVQLGSCACMPCFRALRMMAMLSAVSVPPSMPQQTGVPM